MQVKHEVLELKKQDFFELDEVKNFLRITASYDDNLVRNIINAVIEIAEGYTGICINLRLIRSVLDAKEKQEIKARLKYFSLTAKLQLQAAENNLEFKDLDLNLISYDDSSHMIRFNNAGYQYFSLEFIYEAGFEPKSMPFSLRQAILSHISYIYEYDPKLLSSRYAVPGRFYKQFRHIKI